MYDPARDSWEERKVEPVESKEVEEAKVGEEAEINESNGDKVHDESKRIHHKGSHDELKRQYRDEKEERGHNEERRKLKRPSRRTNDKQQHDHARQVREKMEHTNPRSQDYVKSHYNSRPNVNRNDRKSSPIISLRNFNNFIKSALINRYSPKNSVILDLGCGKGGDLMKWDKNHCQGWIGVDIANVSIDQARERYEGFTRKRFWADFFVGDPFRQQIAPEIIPEEALPVDVVSIQFSLHYAWKSEQTAKQLIENVARSLRPGGKFIGTIPNSDLIFKRVDRLAEGMKEFGNNFYTVKFEQLPNEKETFGNEYFFYLEDAVGDVPEYIVPFDSLVKLAKDNNLEFEYERPFLEMFDEVIDNDRFMIDLAHRMRVKKLDGSLGIEGDQREACGFYRAFSFIKK